MFHVLLYEMVADCDAFVLECWTELQDMAMTGKENGVNILKLIDEGPFQIGTIRDTLAEGIEGAHQLGLERARVYSDLSPEDIEIEFEGPPTDDQLYITEATRAHANETTHQYKDSKPQFQDGRLIVSECFRVDIIETRGTCKGTGGNTGYECSSEQSCRTLIPGQAMAD
ncbi:hypothetical protein Tco_1110611 [Tanacetum coccineum]|uniref:Uncharacterized protein n=1 Tax=Tanacetum coccineum TaxID=301880 RepID=A0ABQ5ILD4_9ASTR